MLRQDTQLVTAAQGWSPTEWQRVADEIAAQRALDHTDGDRQREIPHRHRAGRSRADPEARLRSWRGASPSSVVADVADEQFGPSARGRSSSPPRSRSSTAGTLTTTTLAHATPQSDLASEQQKAAEPRSADRSERQPRLGARRAVHQGAARDPERDRPDQRRPSQRSTRSSSETDAVRGQLAARARRALHGRRQPGAARRARRHRHAASSASAPRTAAAAADQDRQLLDDVKVAVEQLGVQQKRRWRRRAPRPSKRARPARRRRATRSRRRPSEQQALLAQVNGKIKTLVDQIQAEKAREQEAARARRRWNAARAQQAQRSRPQQRRRRASDSVGSSSGGSSTPVDVGSDPQPARRRARRRRSRSTRAKAQLGKPYVYAGSGPDTFDCSGLTMYAWAAAGVSLPHNAEAQYDSLPHVAQIDARNPATSCSSARRSTTWASSWAAAR